MRRPPAVVVVELKKGAVQQEQTGTTDRWVLGPFRLGPQQSSPRSRLDPGAPGALIRGFMPIPNPTRRAGTANLRRPSRAIPWLHGDGDDDDDDGPALLFETHRSHARASSATTRLATGTRVDMLAFQVEDRGSRSVHTSALPSLAYPTCGTLRRLSRQGRDSRGRGSRSPRR